MTDPKRAPGDDDERPGADPDARDAPASPYANLFNRADVERDPTADVGPEDDADLDTSDQDDLVEDEEPARRPRLALLLGGALLLAVIGVGLGVFFSQRPAQVGPNDVVARVGDADITRNDFLRRYVPGQDPQMTMDQLIEIELVVQAARSGGETVDEARLDQEIAEIRASYQGDDAAFMQELQAAYINSEDELRTLLGRQQLIEAMIREHTTVEQFRSRHILLAADSPEAIEQRRAEAEALLAQVQSGGDFAALAREHSDDPGSKEQGGELGWVPRGIFVAEYEDAVSAMQPGEIRLVQSVFGWHIIELQDDLEQRALEDQRYLQTPVGQQAFADTFLPWVEGLRAEAEQANRIAILVPPANLAPTVGPVPTP